MSASEIPSAPAASVPGGRLVPQPGLYAEPIARFTRAAFQPLPQSTRNVLAAVMLAACVIIGLLISTQPEVVWVPAAGLLLVATLVPATQTRWAWGWQAVILAESSRHQAHLSALLGRRLDQVAGADWLARNPAAPVRDRMEVLAFIGHDELAEDLIPELPAETPDERFWRAWEESVRDWRLTSRLETARAADLVPALASDHQRAALAAIDFAGGMVAIWDGHDLRTIAPPARVPLPLSAIPIIGLVRFWLTAATVAGLAIVLGISLLLGALAH